MQLKNRFWWLGLHTAITRAPPDELTGFGSFGNGDQGGGQGDSNNGGGFENTGQQGDLIGQPNEGDDESNPLKDILAQFAEEDPDEDEDQTPVSTDVPPEQVTAMQATVQRAISQMRITDDMIPQDFDASDRGQLTGLMNRVMQHTVAQSLNVVFQPVQLAMKQMATTLQGEIDSKISASRSGMQDQNILEQMVPEINDPQYSGLVKNLDTTLKGKGKKAKDRATTIRKMLNQMGIQGTTSNNRRTSNPGGGGNAPTVRVGHAALDSFFGAFQPPQKK